MIPVARPLITPAEKQAVNQCLDSGWISSKGENIPAFERAFAAYCGRAHGVSVTNGTVALHLALLALGIGPGDEVIVPTLTFVATANAVVHAGAKPVCVDSEAATWNMDPERLAEAVTPATRAVIPVHLYGHPADMAAINQVAEAHGLAVVEDAAEAHGAEVDLAGAWRRVGSFGRASCFSFFANKILTTGEGGMVLTDDEELAAKLRLLRDHGMDPARPYWHPVVGYNFRMTNIQAALGLSQTRRLEEILAQKRKIGELYRQGLAGVAGISFMPHAAWARPVCWLMSIVVEEGFPVGRDALAAALGKRGIETRPFFVPMHTLPPHRQKGGFPVAERLSARGLNLPSGPDIGQEDIEAVCAAIKEVAGAS